MVGEVWFPTIAYNVVVVVVVVDIVPLGLPSAVSVSGLIR